MKNDMKYSFCGNYRPIVTIVTPSYNQGDFIEETIRSVLTQDYPNIEYIVVDGGSSDKTVDILKKYDGKLRWVSERDRGTEDAINKGFKMSQGGIFGWLASDDVYLPGAISKVVAFFNRRPATKLVYGTSRYIDKDGYHIGECPTGTFDYKKLAVDYLIYQPSTFFKRDVFFDVGGLSLDLKYATDYDLWVRIARKFQVEYLPELLSSYRLHANAKTLGCKNQLVRFEEWLSITIKYYNWAPASRVYPYCYYLLKSKIPSYVAKFKLFVQFLAIILSIGKYLQLNRGIKLDDIKLFPSNIKKLLKGWELEDILIEFKKNNHSDDVNLNNQNLFRKYEG